MLEARERPEDVPATLTERTKEQLRELGYVE